MPDQRPPRATIRAAVRTSLADLEPGDRVLVALSGGADSLALLAATVVVARELGVLCGAVVVDHQLQPNSGQVARRAAEQARILGCPDVRVLAVEVASGPGSGGVEAAARGARYAALDRAAGHSQGPPDPGVAGPPATAVLLGHTQDDQAETVLLGLARGSGTRSISGMAPRSGWYRRPLLDLPRAVVARAADEAAAEDPRLTPWADPHNADPAFARVRVRAAVLPAMEQALGPGVSRALARTAQLARADADALDEWAEQVHSALLVGTGPPVSTGVDSAAPGLPLVGLRRADTAAPPPAVVARVVRRFLTEAGCPAGSLTADHVRRVVELIDADNPRAEVALPGGLNARRTRDVLHVRA